MSPLRIQARAVQTWGYIREYGLRTCSVGIRSYSEAADRLDFPGAAFTRARWQALARGAAGSRAPVHSNESSVSSHKVEQRRLHHRGREFHFVSYDAQVANERRGEVAIPPMWYLMNEGKRRPVLPHVPGQELMELDGALLRWVDEQVFGATTPSIARPRRK
jgi:hypothetical protein